MIRQVLRRINHLLHFLSGDGSWKLRAYESDLINAVIGCLAPRIQTLVRAQLEEEFFVERMPAGRINVIRFYATDKQLTIPDPEFDNLLFNVAIEVDGRRQIAHVTFHNGYVFSIELKKPAKFYAGKMMRIAEVKQGNAGQSYTKAIDRMEHGRGDDVDEE